jgi:hypothetical protein
VKGRGRIVGYGVNRKTISIRIDLVDSASVTEELERCKGRQKTIRLDTFQIVGKIESITISKNVGLLVHTARLDFIHRRLFRMMEKESVGIEISTAHQDKLLYFLDTVAKKRDQRPGDLLFELSSFNKTDTNGTGKTIPGKRSVFDLSEAQSNVVLNKISRLSADL